MRSQHSEFNIFQMHVARGEVPGFWVVRDTWENTVAQVVSVGPLKGPPPYFGSPKVMADIYDRSSGAVREAGVRLRVPGSYVWRLVEAPAWTEAREG